MAGPGSQGGPDFLRVKHRPWRLNNKSRQTETTTCTAEHAQKPEACASKLLDGQEREAEASLF